MGGGKAPKPDENIGIAALKSAETGQQLLEWMQSQAEITNEWAAEDRARWQDVFRPLQDQYIKEAQEWDSTARREQRSSQAVADVNQQIKAAEGTRVRQAMAMGINPDRGHSNPVRAGLRWMPGWRRLARSTCPTVRFRLRVKRGWATPSTLGRGWA